eukprot:gene7645-5373_t
MRMPGKVGITSQPHASDVVPPTVSALHASAGVEPSLSPSSSASLDRVAQVCLQQQKPEGERAPREASPAAAPMLSTSRVSQATQEEIIRGMERNRREEAAQSKKRDLFTRRTRPPTFGPPPSPPSAPSAIPHSSHQDGGGEEVSVVAEESGSTQWAHNNNTDLYSFLRTAHRMHTWEEGIDAFCRVARDTLPPQLLDLLRSSTIPPGARDKEEEERKSFSMMQVVAPLRPPQRRRQPASGLPHYTPKHLHLVLTLCADARKWDAVTAIGIYFARAHPSLLVRATELLVDNRFLPQRTPLSPTLVVKKGCGSPWQVEVLQWLASTALPPPEIPVDVFNVVLARCEATRDAAGALYILRSMGPNPLSDLTWDSIRLQAAPDGEHKENGSGKPPTADAWDGGPSVIPVTPFSWPLTPVVAPNVVSYATFIAVLEQCGMSRAASHVVGLLPLRERQEITASYAALIYLWQLLRGSRKSIVMWKYVLQKCGVVLHSAVSRRWVPSKNCMGIVNGSTDEIPSGCIIAAIPTHICSCPTLLASPLRHLCPEIPDYVVENGEADRPQLLCLECSAASNKAILHLAWLSQRTTSEGAYIRFVLSENLYDRHGWKESLSPALVAQIDPKIEVLDKMKDKILHDISARFGSVGSHKLSFECLQNANSLCESRCVEVPEPSRLDLFGGPVFVPFLDLINHDDLLDNVEVSVVPSPFLKKECVVGSPFSPEIPKSSLDINGTPFYVVIRAANSIAPDEELAYPYVRPDDPKLYFNPVYWISRFRFVPPAVASAQGMLIMAGVPRVRPKLGGVDLYAFPVSLIGAKVVMERWKYFKMGEQLMKMCQSSPGIRQRQSIPPPGTPEEQLSRTSALRDNRKPKSRMRFFIIPLRAPDAQRKRFPGDLDTSTASRECYKPRPRMGTPEDQPQPGDALRLALSLPWRLLRGVAKGFPHPREGLGRGQHPGIRGPLRKDA